MDDKAGKGAEPRFASHWLTIQPHLFPEWEREMDRRECEEWERRQKRKVRVEVPPLRHLLHEVREEGRRGSVRREVAERPRHRGVRGDVGLRLPTAEPAHGWGVAHFGKRVLRRREVPDVLYEE